MNCSQAVTFPHRDGDSILIFVYFLNLVLFNSFDQLFYIYFRVFVKGKSPSPSFSNDCQKSSEFFFIVKILYLYKTIEQLLICLVVGQSL